MLKRIRDLFNRRGRTTDLPEDSPDSDPEAQDAALPVRPPEPAPAVHHGPRVVHHPIPESELDPEAVKIVRRLTRFGHTAYFVGGCVRDLLLQVRPKDFDIATTATPRQVRRLFGNCRIIGRRFRLAHIYYQGGKIIEVATFRARDVDDTAAADGEPEVSEDDLLIREDNVFGTPEEDALRRDFTINALFYDVNEGTVIDHAGGLTDLKHRLVRTIGEPRIRFREDPIRILRAIKFAARLDLSIEERTLSALIATRDEIPKAAPPRVLEELNRFCRGGAARASFALMRSTGVFDVVLPELARPYAERPETAPLMEALFAALDRRTAGGREPATGEILGCLLLPALETAFLRRGVPARETVDGLLRPLALRLRVPRKDQERCRQVLATLQRMVPAAALRRGPAQALARRPAFAEALGMLEVQASLRGGVHAESLAQWTAGEAGRGAPTPRPEGAEAPAGDAALAEGASGGRRRRRRSRRRGRGRAEGAEAAGVPQVLLAPGPVPRPSVPRPARPGSPAKWDDDYFFAALPTVPPLPEDEDGTDRYGAEALASQLPEREEGPVEEAAPPGDEPRRRRRRRSRRRGRGGNGGGTAGPEGGSSE